MSPLRAATADIDETIFYADAAPTGLKNALSVSLVIGCQYLSCLHCDL